MSDREDLIRLRKIAQEAQLVQGPLVSSQQAELRPAPEPAIPGALGRGIDKFNDITDILTDRATFNLGGEVAGAGRFVGGKIREAFGGEEGDSLGQSIRMEQGKLDQIRAMNPKAALATDIGGVLVAGGPAAKGVQNVAQAVKRGAGLGAAFGGGEGDTLEDRVARGAAGATVGGVSGGVLQGAGQAIANTGIKIPGVDTLKALARRSFKQADNAGVIVKPQNFSNFTDDLANELRVEGFLPALHPRAAAALKEIQNVKGGAPSLSDLNLLRRVAKSASSSIDADERRIGQIMIGAMDDFVGNLDDTAVSAGNAQVGASAIRQARSLWSRAAKADVIEDLIQRARTRGQQFSGSGFENALRNEFRTFSLNKKRMRGFTKTEQDAIRKVAEGGALDNVMRFIGKLAPTGVISAAASGGGGFALFGPIGAVAVPAAGFAARRGATALTSRNAALASRLARAGGSVPQAQIPQSAQALIRGLTLGGAQQGQRLSQ